MEGLELKREEAMLVATVERGDQNFFSAEMIDALADGIDEAARDPSIVFLRLRARGNVFILGRDRRGETPDELRAEAAMIVRINETLRTSPVISIAEVNGDAAGFGCGIVAASDIAVASTDARFWFPEIGTGLTPTAVIGWASKTLPAKRGFDMVVTGEPVDAMMAAQIGLVTEAVPPEQVEGRVDDRLEKMQALDPAAMREVKRFFVHVRTMDAASAARSSVDALVLASMRMQTHQGGHSP